MVPELPGCSAFGETEEEALREVKVAVSLRLEAAIEEGRRIPEPVGMERLRDILSGDGGPRAGRERERQSSCAGNLWVLDILQGQHTVFPYVL